MRAINGYWRRAWIVLQALSGEDAYDRYLDHQRRRHPAAAPLGRVEFQVSELDRRWSQVNRCC
jgi:uncharacterized short protein YbdD (DUF466 family)